MPRIRHGTSSGPRDVSGWQETPNFRKYNRQLEADARDWAVQCMNKASGTKNGENIFDSRLTNAGIAAVEAVSTWADEGTAYFNGRCVGGGSCDAYKQMVFSGTHSLGCAIKLCDK